MDIGCDMCTCWHKACIGDDAEELTALSEEELMDVAFICPMCKLYSFVNPVCVVQ